MITLNNYRVEQLKKRLPKIENEFDKDVAAFMLIMLKPNNRRWMWKKHEIFKAGGEIAWAGFCKLCQLGLADHWRIDNVYVIAGELYILDFEAIAMKAFGYRIDSTSDGGYWLYHGCHQVNYYRRRGMAKRRALKEIHATIRKAA